MRRLSCSIVFLIFLLCASSCVSALPKHPNSWPNRFSVRFNVTIVNFKAYDLPSRLFFDWDNQQQSVQHFKCPAPFLHSTECKIVFSAVKGTYAIEKLPFVGEVIPACCKFFDEGPVPPFLFSKFAQLNGTETCDSFLGKSRRCLTYDLMRHGQYWVDQDLGVPVKFQAVFPEPAGLVSWKFTENFQPWNESLVQELRVFDIPSICLPKCPLSDLGEKE